MVPAGKALWAGKIFGLFRDPVHAWAEHLSSIRPRVCGVVGTRRGKHGRQAVAVAALAWVSPGAGRHKSWAFALYLGIGRAFVGPGCEGERD